MDIDKLKQYWKDLIANPAKQNLTLSLCVAGIIVAVIGALLSVEFIFQIGTAILGAGIFAAIIKSAQFTNLFQQHISDVFYAPEKIKNGAPLIYKWRTITDAMLRSALPNSHSKAAYLIEKQFFNSDLEYHFEDYRATYMFAIIEGSNLVNVTVVIEATIVLSPCASTPTLTQAITTGDAASIDVKRFFLDGNDCKSSDYCKQSPTDKNKFEINVPLLNMATRNETTGDRSVRMDRCISWRQNFSDEPDIEGEIIRYIKGAVIKAKPPKGYKLIFRKYGLGKLPDNNYVNDDGEGFQRWTLAGRDDLLLPGQGYILLLIPTGE